MIDEETRRRDLAARIRMAKNDEEEIAAMLRLLSFDGEQQRVWDERSSREYFLRLADLMVEYLERKSPRHPWMS